MAAGIATLFLFSCRLPWLLGQKSKGACHAQCNTGQEIKHVKIGHVIIDRAHFRVHFRVHCQISREHRRGSLRGDPVVRFYTEILNFRGHFRGRLPTSSKPRFLNPVFKTYFMDWVCGILLRCFGKSDCHQLGECFAC